MKPRILLTISLALALPCVFAPAFAQERYDDHELRDRFKIKLGGFNPRNSDSTIRIDSRFLGLGTVIDLEDNLQVDDSARVARLDGFYRFNRAHRLEWSYYSLKREGSAFVGQDLQIGEITFPLGFQIDSTWKLSVAKVSYAWSFINTDPYEFYIGAGLNVRDISLKFNGTGVVSGTRRDFDESGTLPQPTLTAGMRYNVLDNLALLFRTEAFALEFGDSKGRIQDTYFLLEYDITRNFGIGGGINLYNLDIEIDKGGDFTGEVESSYLGLLLYLSASF
ncbi:MAG: hypothetical protein O7B81_16610 [Gammaproteobacteria bacterium]|nr:hypothetical protein [Gammaproteobacteria bacterium]